jgi:hypothetical protein
MLLAHCPFSQTSSVQVRLSLQLLTSESVHWHPGLTVAGFAQPLLCVLHILQEPQEESQQTELQTGIS